MSHQPSWNDVTRLFEGNNDVAFGDVNLRESPAFRAEPHKPGAGGWPTIRFFNENTGKDGDSYKKLTSDPMCTELGDRMRMIDYVEDYGNTVLCSVDDGKNCNEQELKYVEKWKDKDYGELMSQYERLEMMTKDIKPMKENLRLWAFRRMRILKRLLAPYRETASGGYSTEEEGEEL